MKFPLFLALFTLPILVHAHECNRFLDSDWRADEGYACSVNKDDLKKLKFHRMEICIGSVPYLDGKRYAHAEYKWVPLSQFNNPYSVADGTNNKFFEKFYTGLSFEGEKDERAYIHKKDGLYLETYREGSSITKEMDYRSVSHLNFITGHGNLTTYYREPSLVFKKSWKQSIQVNFECQRVR